MSDTDAQSVESVGSLASELEKAAALLRSKGMNHAAASLLAPEDAAPEPSKGKQKATRSKRAKLAAVAEEKVVLTKKQKKAAKAAAKAERLAAAKEAKVAAKVAKTAARQAKAEAKAAKVAELKAAKLAKSEAKSAKLAARKAKLDAKAEARAAKVAARAAKAKGAAKGAKAGKTARKAKPVSGQSGPVIKGLTFDDLNKKEKLLLGCFEVKGEREVRTIEQLAAEAFKTAAHSLKKANSWVRNSLRRPVRCGWLEKPEPGSYRLTPEGRKVVNK